MKRLIYFITLAIAFGFIMEDASARRRPPSWVKKRPVEPGYYIGIGMAKKIKNSADHIQIARNNALNDLISEISITISSNSILKKFENNYELTENFETQTKTSMVEELEGYELVASWENKKTDEYWVYYRLSKDVYRQIKNSKIDKAKRLAMNYIEEAQESEKNLELYNALVNYSNALDQLRKYLDEDLSMMTLDGKIYLGNEIMNSVQRILSRIKIESDTKRINISYNETYEKPILISAKYDDYISVKPLSNLPVKLEFIEGSGQINEKIITNEMGMAASNLSKITSKQRMQEIEVALNLDALIGEGAQNRELNLLLFNPDLCPKDKIYIEVDRLKAYGIVDEKVFGAASLNSSLENTFKKELFNNYFAFTDQLENADVILKITSDTKKGDMRKGTGYSIYTVYMDVSVSIINNRNGIEIFSDAIEGLKGIQARSYEYATRDAYEKAIAEIKERIIPKIDQLHL